ARRHRQGRRDPLPAVRSRRVPDDERRRQTRLRAAAPEVLPARPRRHRRRDESSPGAAGMAPDRHVDYGVAEPRSGSPEGGAQLRQRVRAGVGLAARRGDRRAAAERWLAFAGGLILAVDLNLWHESIALVGAGLGTVIANVQVVFVAIAAWLLYGERPSAGRIATIALVL